MVQRVVITEVLTPDEICVELYGTAKAGLLKELRWEHREVRAETRDEWSLRKAHFVPGPTMEAMMVPKFRRYIEKEGRHADTERHAEREPAPEVRHGRVHTHRARV
jgi:hypothetical protein